MWRWSYSAVEASPARSAAASGSVECLLQVRERDAGADVVGDGAGGGVGHLDVHRRLQVGLLVKAGASTVL